jgi:DNA-binding XRE family transcriptional regulator
MQSEKPENVTRGQGGGGAEGGVPTGLSDSNGCQTEDPQAKRARTFKEIRKSLGRTQGELAVALGLSAKAVQSYEQGWRPVPVRVMIQLLVLLSLYRSQSLDEIPCWEIRKCELSLRKRCPSYTVGGGKFCWFIGFRECVPPSGASEDDVMPCMSCPVVQRLMKSGAWQERSSKEGEP